jgi:ABC-2 type transport system ATP-binding protein
MMSYAVEVDGLRVVRGGREVVRELTFQVPRGSVVGLLGPSGCGKTTLMRAVVGVQIVAGGSVTVLATRPAAGRCADASGTPRRTPPCTPT